MMAAGATTSTPSAPPPSMMGVGWFAPRSELAGDVADGLDQFLGHPADRGENFAQGESRQDAAAWLDAVFAFAGGPLFQGVVDLVPDPAGLLHGLSHGKDETGNGHFRPLLQVEAVGRMVANAVAAAGFTEIGVTFARMDEDNGHLGLVSVTLADHLGGGAQLAGRAIDRGGGAKSAQFEFKDCRGMTVGKGDGIELAETVTAAEVIAQFRILVTEDAPVPEVEVSGEKGADAKLGGGTDDGQGGGLDADLAGAFPLPAAADGEALGPAEVFAIVGVDEFRFAIIRRGTGGVGIQVNPFLRFFGTDHAADAGVTKNQGEGSGPKPFSPGGEFLMAGPSQQGETGAVEEKTQNHEGKPTQHDLQGKGTGFSCKTGDRSGIDPNRKKRDSVSS